MDHTTVVEEKLVSERISNKLEIVKAEAKKQLKPIQDHLSFNLQRTYFKCAYECFDRTQSQNAVNKCVERCQIPGLTASNIVEAEMAKFQRTYFKCACECFDRTQSQNAVNKCVERCQVPGLIAGNIVEAEMAKFQERMNRSLMVCQDRFETAKLQKLKSEAMADLEKCVDRTAQENVQILPHVVNKLKASLSMN